MRVTKTSYILGAAAAAVLFAACSREVPDATDPTRRVVEEVGAAEIRRSPQLAERLNVSPDIYGGRYSAALDDRSMAAADRARVARLDALAALETLNPFALSNDDRREYDALHFLLEADARLGRRGHGASSLGRAVPYAASQFDGAYLDIPHLLAAEHSINVLADAQDYLTRLRSVAAVIDDERRRIEAEAALGFAAPAESLLAAAEAARSLVSGAPDEAALLAPLSAGLDRLGVAADVADAMRADARDAFETEIAPAYGRLADAFEATAADAPNAAPGIGRLATGDAYYRDVVYLYANAETSPSTLHERALAVAGDLALELDASLAGLGMTEGSPSSRIAALRADTTYLLANDDEGRGAALTLAATTLSTAAAEAPFYFEIAAGAVDMRPAPRGLREGAASRYRPRDPASGAAAAVFFKLDQLEERPVWTLPTRVFREAIPGRHQAAAYAAAAPPPLVRTIAQIPAFSDGWAHYAEALADEMGLYDETPAARIGYLQSSAAAAARVVADTGLHDRGWDRAQATAYLVDAAGMSQAQAETEIDRIIVRPGRAIAAFVGREALMRMREEARRALGPDFDIKAFHGAVLAPGPRPLGVVETDVQLWIAQTRAARGG